MSWLSRLLNVFRQDQLSRDLDDELLFHAEQRAAADGISPAEARRRLGNTLRLREQSRDVKLAVWLETLLQDVRLSLRLWRKRPLIALTAILTIALGAGMNVAMFRILWNVMLKPLPYQDPSRLVQLWVDDGKEERTLPGNLLLDRWRDESQSLSHIASYRPWSVTVAASDEPEQVFAAVVSHEFFETLGTPLLAGRSFTPAEVHPGADNVVLLRESYWRRRFAARTTLLGTGIIVDGTLCTVIGIVPHTFEGATLIQAARRGAPSNKGDNIEPEVYLPLSRGRIGGMKLPLHTSFAIARLRPGFTPQQAQEELASLIEQKKDRRVWLSSLASETTYQVKPALLALIASTFCILLIACANLANLLLAQAVQRRRELAVRSALGAGRARVVRQLITEAMVLSLAGGLVGLAAAKLLSRLIVNLYPESLPRLTGDSFGSVVYLFAIAATLVSGVLFGALPAWRGASESAEEALRVGNLWMSRNSRRWTNVMVVVQVAFTAIVLVAAGLLLKSFLLLRDADLGIARQNIVTASVDLPQSRYPTREDRARFGTRWLQALNEIPGVSSAGISNSLPLRYITLLSLMFRVPGVDGERVVGGRAVAGDYFEALGMHFVDGVPFDGTRKDQVVVNEAFVRKYLAGRSPIGFLLPQGKDTLVITGVVKDVLHRGVRQLPEPEVFLPYASFPLNPMDTVVRSALPPDQIISALRRQLHTLDAQVALGRPMTIQDVIDGQFARPRFYAVLLGLFAAVAVAMAALGTYGVIAYHVRSRVPELGLRRALGAPTSHLLRLVLSEGLKAPLIGLALGFLGALAASPFLQSLVYGITPHDPVVLLSTLALLAAVSLAACLIPGRAATRVEPHIALRQE